MPVAFNFGWQKNLAKVHALCRAAAALAINVSFTSFSSSICQVPLFCVLAEDNPLR
jgi:hypothetical protein